MQNSRLRPLVGVSTDSRLSTLCWARRRHTLQSCDSMDFYCHPPDTDNDGFPDDVDQCPNEAGDRTMAALANGFCDGANYGCNSPPGQWRSWQD